MVITLCQNKPKKREKIMNNKKAIISVYAADFETQLNPVRVQSFAMAKALIYSEDKFDLSNEKTPSYQKDATDIYYYDNYGNDVISDFIDYLDRTMIGTCKVFFHNLKSFDGWFILPELVKRYGKNTINMPNKYNPNIKASYGWTIANNQILAISLQTSKALVIFYDTASYFSMKLEHMAKLINKEKGNSEITMFNIADKDKDPKTYEEFVKYAKLDVEILRDFLFKNIDMTKFNFYTKMTAAGASISYIKEAIENDATLSKSIKTQLISSFKLRDNISGTDIKNLWEIGNLSYFGAYTHSNKKYIDKKLICDYFDINSSYPSIMTEHLPVTYIKDPKDGSKYLKLHQILIIKAKLKKHYTPIIRNVELSSTFYEGIEKPLSYYVWEEELVWFEKFYDIEYEIVNTWHFKSRAFLKKYIEDLYSKRQTYKKLAKENPDVEYYKVMEQSLKIVLNSIYGKFGQKYNQPIVTLDKQDLKPGDTLTVEMKYYHKNKDNNKFEKTVGKQELIVRTSKKLVYETDAEYNVLQAPQIDAIAKTTGYQMYITTIKDDENDNKKIWLEMYNIFIASYITMRGRCKLFEQIYRLTYKDDSDFVYCDTDSIVTKGQFFGSQDNNKLGYWKKEYSQVEFTPYRSKRYALKTQDGKIKTTVAGYSDFSNNLTSLEDLNNKMVISKLSKTINNKGVVLKKVSSYFEKGKIYKIT